MIKTSSSYFDLPFKNNSRYGIINFKNINDNKCFLYSVLSLLYPAEKNSCNISNYKNFENKLNMEGIEFPVKLKDLQQFENQNENISINVFKLREPDNVKSFYPVYISKFTNRENNLDLLYLTKDEKKDEKKR